MTTTSGTTGGEPTDGSGTTLRVTVCELTAAGPGEPAWTALAAGLRDTRTELLVLPEMPWAPWLAAAPAFDPGAWRSALAAHDEGVRSLPALGVPAVVSSRPVERAGRRRNEAFLWTERDGYRPLHLKSRLPAEDGFWEQVWFDPGPEPAATGAGHGPAVVAAAICSELWHFERARTAGRAGVNLLVTPRATSAGWTERWLLAGRAAALSGGAFSVSANRAAGDGVESGFGGCGWIIDPDGEVLGRTSAAEPLVTREIDLGAAERARATYPRNLVGPGTG
uniref:Amidohydrolase-like protein n=1 Tax=uncultured bacterium BAC AB649/1850 TaxID=1037453 RepID=F6K0Y5_9BACT|nr:amidohydrolase-like protein [uncultured bacterium BAC AB649/1850]